MGRGTIVYEGNQDPNSDEGWMQIPDWHCIGSVDAHNVEIDGLTCIVRARTWSIQMRDSFDFTFDDLRVIGGNPGNANQDGMDWLGGGDSIVRDAFIRASDDDLAMQGNWDGYSDEDMLRPGKDVEKILIENSVLSTSISNIVRSAWPRKIFNSSNFTLRDSDVLHAGIGACGQAFGLLGMWGADGAKGDHSNYTFENIFLDNWYSLLQMEQEQPGIHDFVFRNIWALDQPPLVDSTLTGDVTGVTFDNVKYAQTPRSKQHRSAAAGERRRATAAICSCGQPACRFHRRSAIHQPRADRHLRCATLARSEIHVAVWRRRARHRPQCEPQISRRRRHRAGWGCNRRGPLPRSAARGSEAGQTGLGGAGRGRRGQVAQQRGWSRTQP